MTEQVTPAPVDELATFDERMRQKRLLYAAREWLCHEMAAMSEEMYSAGWYTGWEFLVWDAATGRGSSVQVENLRVLFGPQRIGMLLEVAEACGSWCVLSDSGDVVPIPLEQFHRIRRESGAAE